MSFSGFVNAALQLGVQSISVTPQRGIANIIYSDGTTSDDIQAQVVAEERHMDVLQVTEHPVEQGSPISDHAYRRPAEVVLKLGWSNSPTRSSSLVSSTIGVAAANNPTVLSGVNAVGVATGVLGLSSALSGAGIDQIKAIYDMLLNLQLKRALFTLYTGKRIYKNMICVSLSTESDWRTANQLPIVMACQEVFLVETKTVQLPAASQASPQDTASPVNNGTQSLKPVGTLAQ